MNAALLPLTLALIIGLFAVWLNERRIQQDARRALEDRLNREIERTRKQHADRLTEARANAVIALAEWQTKMINAKRRVEGEDIPADKVEEVIR